MSADTYPVYLGHWVNWTRGPVFGATLTVERNTGNLLIAFVAFFVGWVGSCFWRILCLSYYSWQMTSRARPAYYHQRQAVLRNSASAEAGLWSLLQISWAWRKTHSRVWLTMLPAMAMSAMCGAVFLVASGFSSQVSTGSTDEVLLTGAGCAYTDITLNTSVDAISTVWNPYLADFWNSAANYAQQCYNQDGLHGHAGFTQCGTFVQDALPFTMVTNASCPFADVLCKTNDSNIFLDTGLLDSHTHLGLNMPPDQRIRWRKTLHCAPVVTEGYTSTWTSDQPGLVGNFTRYHYGQTNLLSDRTHNFTFEYADEQARVFNITRTDYSLNGISWDPPLRMQGFTPIPGLQIQHAELTLVFLSANGMMFVERTPDLWYSATTPGPRMGYPLTDQLDWNETFDAYRADTPASPLACLEQQQLCSPSMSSADKCTPLSSWGELATNAQALITTGADSNRGAWFYNAITSPGHRLRNLFAYLGTEALTARYSTSGNLQGPLAANQWQLDARYWFTIMLANAQTALVRTALGFDASPEMRDWFTAGPQSPESDGLCRGQRIRALSGYTSFSLFGLGFVFFAGALVVLASYLAEPCLGCCYHKRLSASARDSGRASGGGLLYPAWMAHSTLQLQRLAYEGSDAGTWRGGCDSVPVTDGGDLLPGFWGVGGGESFVNRTEKPACHVSEDPGPEPEARGETAATTRAV